MMPQDKPVHRIRVQRVDVEFEKPEDAFKIRDQLSEVCRYRLIPAMEKLFKEKYATGPHLSIPRLEIDAGRVNVENWESELVKAIIARLEYYLDEKGAGGQLPGGTPGIGADTGIDVDSGIAVDSGTGKREKDHAIAAERKRGSSFILYYLKNGVQPWNSPWESKEQLKSELLNLLKGSHRFLKSISFLDSNSDFRDDFSRELIELLATDLNAVKRLLYLLPEKNILPVLIKKGWDRGELKKTRKNWNVIFGLAGLPEGEHNAVFIQALSLLYGKPKQKKQLFAEMLSQETVRVLEQWHKPVFLKLPEVLEKYLILLPGKPVLKYRRETMNFPAPEAPPIQLIEDPVYINNAGLVLLHPFLHYLFENAGHTMKNKWDSTTLQQRSLVMTQFLVSGQDDYTEHDLFLNKLIIGFPVHSPLPLDIILSDFEKKEAKELLESVISHWKALKNTSIFALRDTFLLRPGKISRKENGWLLEVDQRVPDVLLGKIPWGFSTIKTPWMNEILNVEWA